jgi:hypothetical protein
VIKQAWQTPKLVVLVRGEPGEVLTAHCKSPQYTGLMPGPSIAHNKCDDPGPSGGCQACQAENVAS